MPMTDAEDSRMRVGGIAELRRWRAEQSGRVGLVPTMGALHSGHRALMDRAREDADVVVTSIFVNPLQFGPEEDFDRYPRPLEDDLALCAEAGVDFVFAPGLEEMYPTPPEVRVSAGRMGDVFEGAGRPGHFDGVLTVVTKLFTLSRPDVAVFGLKDIQQYLLVERLIVDLDLGVDLIGLPVVRDADGLAMSSRNAYLSGAQRSAAAAIPRALAAAGGAAAARDSRITEVGRSDADAAGCVRRARSGAVEDAARVVLEAAASAGELTIDYVSLVDRATLHACDPEFRGSAVLLVCAVVGGTRLIDNLLIEL